MLFRVVISNIFYFHPYLGKLPILTNIFQMGWNHQPVFNFLRFFFVMEFPIRKSLFLICKFKFCGSYDLFKLVKNHFLFTSIPGEMIQINKHIFQMGWNYQLAFMLTFRYFRWCFSKICLGKFHPENWRNSMMFFKWVVQPPSRRTLKIEGWLKLTASLPSQK